MSDPLQNPYRPPQVVQVNAMPDFIDADDAFLTEARKVDAGRGSTWIEIGWESFKRASGLWIAVILIYYGLSFAIGSVPAVGQIVSFLITPLLQAGLFSFARGVQRGGSGDIAELFTAFSHPQRGNLVLLGLMYMGLIALSIVVGLVLFIVMAGVASGMMSVEHPEMMFKAAANSGGLVGLLVPFLIMLALVLATLAAYWFAVPLVFFAGMTPVNAMKASLEASLRNWLPLTVFGFLALLVLLGGFLALFIGLIVAIPAVVAAQYASFEDMFGRRAE